MEKTYANPKTGESSLGSKESNFSEVKKYFKFDILTAVINAIYEP